jgi:hypothetical protein
MQACNFWNKHNLYCAKVIVLIFLFLSVGELRAQALRGRTNNPGYDERKFSYGFLIGIHQTAYQIKYADTFVKDMDDLHSVEPDWKPGFSLGFIVNYRVAEYVDLRVTPTVAFYEHILRYRYIDRTSKEELVETTMVEFPLLLKYKSARRDNIRAYMIGGVKPGIEASGKKVEDNQKGLDVKGFDLSLEAGIGLDLYFPLFKFSPEIRFSRGVMNVLDNRTNEFGKPLKYVNTNTITVILLFQ